MKLNIDSLCKGTIPISKMGLFFKIWLRTFRDMAFFVKTIGEYFVLKIAENVFVQNCYFLNFFS